MKRRCVVCDEKPARADFCLRCEDMFVMALEMKDSFVAIARWAARRARRFERKRWWHLRPKGVKP